MNPVLNIRIADLCENKMLPIRVYNAINHEVETLDDLIKLSEWQLRSYPNIGVVSVNAVKVLLKRYGLRLRKESERQYYDRFREGKLQ